MLDWQRSVSDHDIVLGRRGVVVREQSSVAACFCVCDDKLKTLYVTRVHLSPD